MCFVPCMSAVSVCGPFGVLRTRIQWKFLITLMMVNETERRPQVLIAGVEVDEEGESLVQGNAADAAALEAWRGRLGEGASWWPSAGMDEETRDRCWKVRGRHWRVAYSYLCAIEGSAACPRAGAPQAARVLLVGDGRRPLR